jgi:predicted transglutaminase-like cysteine proteinase
MRSEAGAEDVTTTTAPLAWTIFENNPPQFSKRQWIEKVNLFVNNGIYSESGDPPELDVYRVWPERGWCHDYAITKRYELLRRDFTASELQLCTCVANGTRHMVLIADGWVMDNLNQQVRPFAQLGYANPKRQSATDPNFWEA